MFHLQLTSTVILLASAAETNNYSLSQVQQNNAHKKK